MSDAGLVSAMTFDDVDAFAEAYDRHGDAVYGVARAEAAVHAGQTTPPDSAARAASPAGKAVGRLLSGLLEAEYRVITLAYFGGYTYQEIAALVERPEDAVLADIRAGLRRLSDREP